MTRFVESACRSFAHGVRWLTRRPLSSLSACLCLGVGIGACAAAWTLIDAAILRPFGLPASQRLLVIWETDPAHQRDLIEVSHLNFLDWQHETRTLESMAAFGSSHWPAMARIDHETVSLATRGVSTTFFATLGISPALGRDFATVDLQPNASPPVMLSHRLWQTRFAASPGIVDQPLFINGEDYRILGVMPRGFGYPDDPDAWLSVERELASAFASMPLDQQRAVGVLEVLARRRPEASHDEVRAEISGIVQTVLSPARLLATLMTWLGAAGLLLLTLGIFGAAATALRAALPEIAVRQAVGALPLQAVRAPLGTLARALTTGMVAGLMVTPVALSAAEALGLAAGEPLAGPLVTGTVAVLLAAAIAIGPSMWRASTASPADLLRER